MSPASPGKASRAEARALELAALGLAGGAADRPRSIRRQSAGERLKAFP